MSPKACTIKYASLHTSVGCIVCSSVFVRLWTVVEILKTPLSIIIITSDVSRITLTIFYLLEAETYSVCHEQKSVGYYMCMGGCIDPVTKVAVARDTILCSESS